MAQPAPARAKAIASLSRSKRSSRRHAAIEQTPEGYVVSDAGSLNGTYVNQERIERAVLHHGDELQVGKFRLVLFERTDG